MKKKLIAFLTVLMAVAFLAGMAWAVTTGAMSAGNSTTDAMGHASIIAPGDSNAHTRFLAVNATSDLATSKLRVYWSTGTKTTLDTASSATTLNVLTTSGFADGDLIAVQTAGGAVIERYVTVVTGDDSGTLTIDSALTTGYGDVGTAIYKMAAQWDAAGDGALNSDADWPVGNATVEKINAGGVIIGPRGSPIILSIQGTAAASINYATWDFK